MTDKFLQRKQFPVGAYIFKEGEEGSVAYVIQEGAVDIVKMIDGEEKVLGSVGAGSIFGEMALIDNQPRMAAAKAVESTTVIIVTRQMFEEKLRKSDPFIRGLLHILADNIRRVSSKK